MPGLGVEASAEHERTAVFLLMGRDRAGGVIKLASPAPGIFIDWDVHPNLPLYDTETELSADFAAALKGRPGTQSVVESAAHSRISA